MWSSRFKTSMVVVPNHSQTAKASSRIPNPPEKVIGISPLVVGISGIRLFGIVGNIEFHWNVACLSIVRRNDSFQILPQNPLPTAAVVAGPGNVGMHTAQCEIDGCGRWKHELSLNSPLEFAADVEGTADRVRRTSLNFRLRRYAIRL